MRAGLKSLVLPAVLTCVMLAVLISLGNWQVRRLAWKEDLIARVHDRTREPSIDMRGTDLATVDTAAFLKKYEYAPVLLSGTYEPAGEVKVFTSLSEPRGPYGGPGYWVLTPFVTSPSGASVFVNRGFIPDGKQVRYDPPPSGEQRIEGLVRSAVTRNWLTPDPKVEDRVFFVRDPAEIARLIGVKNAVGGFFIDLDASYTPLSGLPQAGETRMSFPNNHLQYAITWYGLAAALAAVFAVSSWRRLKEPQSERLTRPGRHL